MRRVLLVIEDYNELVFLETLLRKMGLDVLSIQNDGAVSEKILEFRPEMIVATARGRRVNGLKLGPKLKRQRGLPHLLLLAQGAVSNEEVAAAQADAVVPSPLQPREFVSRMAKVAGLDVASFVEKFDKLGMFDTEAVAAGKSQSRPGVPANKPDEDTQLVHWKEGRRLDTAIAEKLAEKKAKKPQSFWRPCPSPLKRHCLVSWLSSKPKNFDVERVILTSSTSIENAKSSSRPSTPTGPSRARPNPRSDLSKELAVRPKWPLPWRQLLKE